MDKNLDCGITRTHELEVSSCKETVEQNQMFLALGLFRR